MEVASFTITSRDPLENFLVPVPKTLCSTGLEILVPERGMLPPGDTTTIPLNWKLRLLPGYFWLLTPLNQARKGVTVLAGVNDHESQGEIGLVLHNGGKREYFWNTGNPLRCFLVLP